MNLIQLHGSHSIGPSTVFIYLFIYTWNAVSMLSLAQWYSSACTYLSNKRSFRQEIFNSMLDPIFDVYSSRCVNIFLRLLQPMLPVLVFNFFPWFFFFFFFIFWLSSVCRHYHHWNRHCYHIFHTCDFYSSLMFAKIFRLIFKFSIRIRIIEYEKRIRFDIAISRSLCLSCDEPVSWPHIIFKYKNARCPKHFFPSRYFHPSKTYYALYQNQSQKLWWGISLYYHFIMMPWWKE